MAKDPICGMAVDEKSVYHLTVGGKHYFFCSEHCVKKFADANNIPKETIASCLAGSKIPLYRNKTIMTAAILAVLILLSYGI